MKHHSQKGIFLIYVLMSVALLTVFMLGTVEKLHQTIFLAKKLHGENKAFWASEAGLAYAEYRLKQNIGWPFLKESPAESTSFGDFTITEKKTDGNKGMVVHGITADETAEFCIYFSKNITKKTADGTEYSSIVPNAFPNEPKNLKYCSYSSITNDTIQQIYSNNTEKFKYSNDLIETSSNPTTRRAIVTAPGVYIASEGRSGVYKCITEKMFIADNAHILGAGLYAGGDVNITLSNSDASFSIVQSSNAKPEIYCKKNVLMTRNNSSNTKNESYIFPFTADDGTIYYGNNFSLTDNAYNKKYDSDSRTMKRDYGLNIDKYTDQEFPKLSWNDIKRTMANVNMAEIACGTYAAIFDNDSKEFELYYFDRNFFPKDQIEQKNLYGYLSKELSASLTAARGKQREAQKYYDKHKNDGHTVTVDGKKKWVSTYDGPSQEEINAMFRDEVSKEIYGVNLSNFKNQAAKEEAIRTTKDAINVFKIEKLTLNNTRSSMVTVKQSARAIPTKECDSLSFIVMDNIGSEDAPNYVIKTDVASDFVLGDKSAPATLTSILFNQSGVSNAFQGLLSTKSTAATATLYCDGAIAINSKLSGSGQLLSGKYVYAQTGSEINTNVNEANSSNISIYAGGSVVLDSGLAQHDISTLYSRIQECAKGVKGENISEITAIILDKDVKKTKEDLFRIADNTANTLLTMGGESTSLKNLMTQFYGYSEREAEYFIKNTVERNALKEYTPYETSSLPLQNSTSYKVSYKMPENASDIQLKTLRPSEFSGLIYACGGFRFDGGDSDLTINGSLVSYGGNPAICNPGENLGIDISALVQNYQQEKGADNGDVNIECHNFSLVYDSSDLAALTDFVSSYGNKTTKTNLTTIFYNKI